MRERIEKLSQWLHQQQIDIAWITSPTNVYYFTGCYINPHERLFGVFVFGQQDPFLLCPRMEEKIVCQAGWSYPVISYDDSENPWQLIEHQLKQHSSAFPQSIAIEKEHFIYARWEKLNSWLPKVHLVGLDPLIQQLRLLKEEKEIRVLRKAAALADEAMQIGVDSLKEGVTESEVAAKIEFAMKKQGIDDMSFQTIVLFGNKTALPHGIPSQNCLQAGDLILIDLGIKVDGYCSDMTRTFAFKKVDLQQKEIYQTVLEVQQKVLSECKPGIEAGYLDQVAQTFITNRGLEQYIMHRTGHGLGLNIHEPPSIHRNNKVHLQKGMVITIEPGLYVPQVGGVRIEDDVLITADGHEVLTRFPKQLQILN